MKRNSHAFINQIVVCVLCSISFGGTIGLGTVWMRYQISRAAESDRAFKSMIADIDRQIGEKTTLIARAEAPDELQRRNEEMRIGLVPPNDPRVKFVDFPDNPALRLAQRANRNLFGDEPQSLQAAVLKDARLAPAKITFALHR